MHLEGDFLVAMNGPAQAVPSCPEMHLRPPHVANICSRKGHSPASNARRLKVLFAVVTEEHNQCIVTILGDHNSVTKPSASLHETGFLLQLQRIWE